jgi:Replication-relaxation
MVLSRFSTEPKRDDEGNPRKVFITAGDRARFHIQARYPYLNRDYLTALTGQNSDAIRERNNQLKRKPGLYLRLFETDDYRPTIYNKLIYQLTPKTESLIGAKQSEEFTGAAEHRIMSCEIRADFEIGASKAGVPIISFDDILHSPNLPQRTRGVPDPWNIPFTIDVNGRQEKRKKRPDCHPFGLKTNRVKNDRPFYPFFALEADRANERIASFDMHRPYIRTKFAEYIEILKQEAYAERYGFSYFYVLFITTGTRHMQSMMTLLEEMTEHDKRYRKQFCFTVHRNDASGYRPPILARAARRKDAS